MESRTVKKLKVIRQLIPKPEDLLLEQGGDISAFLRGGAEIKEKSRSMIRVSRGSGSINKCNYKPRRQRLVTSKTFRKSTNMKIEIDPQNAITKKLSFLKNSGEVPKSYNSNLDTYLSKKTNRDVSQLLSRKSNMHTKSSSIQSFDHFKGFWPMTLREKSDDFYIQFPVGNPSNGLYTTIPRRANRRNINSWQGRFF